jgi:hypothetical protein
MRTVRVLPACALLALAAAGLRLHALAACRLLPSAVLIEHHFAREESTRRLRRTP